MSSDSEHEYSVHNESEGSDEIQECSVCFETTYNGCDCHLGDPDLDESISCSDPDSDDISEVTYSSCSTEEERYFDYETYRSYTTGSVAYIPKKKD